MKRLHQARAMLSRRKALLGMSVAATLGHSSLSLANAETQNRLVVVLLRGAMDGLGAVVPYGDPDLLRLRAALVPPPPGREGGLADLGGFFGLHPALSAMAEMYRRNEMLPLHAIAGPARSRSHFDSQDVLEMGSDHRLDSGWLNRVAALVPSPAGGEVALAMEQVVPLLLRGPQMVGTYSEGAQAPPAAFLSEMLALHADDTLTRKALIEGLKERGFTSQVLQSAAPDPLKRNGFPRLARIAGELLAAPSGPRLAALECAEAWDTHLSQVPRLTQALHTLDDGMAALREGLGAAWARSVVVVVTEFGRTVRVNGSFGTDHGTGSAAFLLGGPVAGGKVRADWPGLADRNLFEGRDLLPTTDLRSLLKGVLAHHFGLDAKALATVFPDSATVPAMSGLLRG